MRTSKRTFGELHTIHLGYIRVTQALLKHHPEIKVEDFSQFDDPIEVAASSTQTNGKDLEGGSWTRKCLHSWDLQGFEVEWGHVIKYYIIR